MIIYECVDSSPSRQDMINLSHDLPDAWLHRHWYCGGMQEGISPCEYLGHIGGVGHVFRWWSPPAAWIIGEAGQVWAGYGIRVYLWGAQAVSDGRIYYWLTAWAGYARHIKRDQVALLRQLPSERLREAMEG